MKDNKLFIKKIKEDNYAVHYQVHNIMNIIYHLSVASVESFDRTKQQLTPADIFNFLEKNEIFTTTNSLDNILIQLFKDFSFLNKLFDKNYNDFCSFDIKKEIKPYMTEKPIYDFGNHIPDTMEAFIQLFEKNIEDSNNPYVEKINLDIIKIIFNKEDNPEYAEQAFESFKSIFVKNKEKQKINEEWFYKYPRVSQVSISGDLDMAYYSAINNSDLIGYMIKALKKVYKNQHK